MEAGITPTLSAAEMKDFVSALDNLTEEDDVFLDPRIKLANIYYYSLAISLLGLVGNVIVFIFIMIERWNLFQWIRRNPFTIYICMLAVNNFTFLIFFSTSAIVHLMVLHGLIIPETFIVHYEMMELGHMFAFLSNQYLLTTISVEGCLCVWYPLWYRSRRHKLQSAIVCAVVLLLPLVLTGTWHFVCGYEYQGCPLFHRVLSFLDFFMFVPAMLLSSLTPFIKICRSSQRRQTPWLSILLLTTVSSFLLLAVLPKLLVFLDVPLGNFATVILFLCLNISLNPVICFLVVSLKKRQIKSSMQMALQMVFQHELDVPLQQHTAPVQLQLLPACSAGSQVLA